MLRVVEPELLDDLPPGDRQAISSRADLRRLNLLMGHAGILSRALLPQLIRNDADERGARGVSPAVFGVPPKTSRCRMDTPLGGPWVRPKPVGGTPTGATGTVALPVSTASFQLIASPVRARPLRLVELGAGDGTLLLRLARRWSALGVTAQLTLLDRQLVVSTETRRAFAALNWSVDTVATDVFTWLQQPAPPVDVILANLFLHHFPDERLGTLLQLAAPRTNLFIACEPRRSPLALTASRCLGLLGCNAITRHDAVVSVRAGFTGHELSALWPAGSDCALSEHPAGLFSHCFVAQRNV